MATLDDMDRRLLVLLEANAREPTVSLARKLGVSRATVQSRMSRLVQGGTIERFTLAYGDGVKGSLLRAHVMVKAAPRKDVGLQAMLRKMPEVDTLYSVSGVFDIIVLVKADTIEEIDRVLDRIRNWDGVENTTSSIILAERYKAALTPLG